MLTRRNVLLSSLAGLVGMMAPRKAAAQHQHQPPAQPATRPPAQPAARPSAPPRNRRGRTLVVTPNASTLPFRMEGGVKVFHLVAEPVKREFAPGLIVNAWGYNGQTPGPTIEAFEGDRVRILVENRLAEGTSIHWHGVRLPNGMDGVSGLTQPKIVPGETYVYEFTLNQTGTLMYHPHFDEMVQIAMGMQGLFIIHPRDPNLRRVDHDFAIMLNEWFIKPGTATPDPTVMLDFNIFTMNSRVFPGVDHLPVRLGNRVRIRLANLSMNSHPIHIHGHRFWITGTDAGPIPESAWWPENTTNVPVGATRDVEFIADNAGDWAFHCHKTHHIMNQMGHDLPNMIGVDTRGAEQRADQLVPGTMIMGQAGMGDMSEHVTPDRIPRNAISMMGMLGPFGAIEMGGMFTIVKVRQGGDETAEGWYRHPRGTVAYKVGEGAPAAAHEHGR